MGIGLAGSGNGNVVEGNFIGTDPTGTQDRGNGNFGILLFDSSSFNRIGGSTPAARNVVSGNDLNGIQISSGTNHTNTILGNYIGTNAAGTAALRNGSHGIAIFGSAANTVGGTSPGARNVISGNGDPGSDGDGIVIYGSGAVGNTVSGNYIGTDATGSFVIPNLTEGASIGFISATNNTIGGTAPGSGNVISGNGREGVALFEQTQNNVVAGNIIGLNPTGVVRLPNAGNGIAIVDGAVNNTIGGTVAGSRNVISGNGDQGIVIADGGTNSNRVQGNYIGTDITGLLDLGNLSDGVLLIGGPNSNLIGGVSADARNVISGNDDGGVVIVDGANNNDVQGNYIGVAANGSTPLGNDDSGVVVETANNEIGGTATGAGNVISGNGGHGGVRSVWLRIEQSILTKLDRPQRFEHGPYG